MSKPTSRLSLTGCHRFIIVTGILNNDGAASLAARLAAWFPKSRVTMCHPFAEQSAVIKTQARELLKTAMGELQIGGEAVGEEANAICVFFGFELGGAVVKQALVIAASGAPYRRLANATTAVFFFGGPHRAHNSIQWRQQTDDLIRLEPVMASKLLKTRGDLAVTLAALASNFGAVSGAYRLLCVYSSSQADSYASSNTLYHDTLDPIAADNFRSEQGHSGGWDLSEKGLTAEWTRAKLAALESSPHRDGDSDYVRFFQQIAQIDTRTYKVQVAPPAATTSWPTMEWVARHDAFRGWRASSGCAFLVLHGEPGVGARTLMAHVVRATLEELEVGSRAGDACCYISFDFGVQQHPHDGTSMALSLIRQVLAFRPSLFRHAVILCGSVTVEHGCTNASVLWAVLRSLLAHLYSIPVLIAIRGFEPGIVQPPEQTDNNEPARGEKQPCEGETEPFLYKEQPKESEPSEEAIEPNEKDNKPPIKTNGVLENIRSLEGPYRHNILVVMTTGTSGWWKNEERQEGIHSMNLTTDKSVIESTRTLVERRVDQVLETRTAWHKLKPDVMAQLCPEQQNYFWAMAKLHLLEAECTSLFSTTAALRERIQQFPSDIPTFLRRVVQRMPRHYAWYLTDTLSWIEYASQPLKMTELAVAVAFGQIKAREKERHTGAGDPGAFGTMNDLIPSDLPADINRMVGMWLTVDEDGYVAISNETLRKELVAERIKQPQEARKRLFLTCFEFIARARAHLRATGDETNFSALSIAQQDFLAYAALNWPNHADVAVRAQVTDFLTDPDQVAFWTAVIRRYGHYDADSDAHQPPLLLAARFGIQHFVDDAIAEALKESREAPGSERGKELSALLRDAVGIAIQERHVSIALRLYDAVQDPLYQLPLYLAASMGFSSLVREFLKPNIDGSRLPIDAPNADGFTALHIAVRGGHKDTVAVLFEHGAEVNVVAVHSSLSTPLHLAATNGQTDIAAELIRRGADWRICDHSGYNTIGLAIRCGLDELVKLLVEEHHAELGDIRPADQSALHLAAMHGHRSTCDYLIHRACADPRAINSSGETPLHLAVWGGFLDTVEQLLNVPPRDGPPSPEMKISKPIGQAVPTPLQIAAQMGHVNIIAYMLESEERSPPSDVLRALRVAASAGQLEAVDMLLERFTAKNPIDEDDRDGTSALHAASLHGHVPVVRALVRSGKFEVDFKGPLGRTALHLSSREGLAHVVSALIELGASVRSTTELGETALHLAVSANKADVLRILHAADNGCALLEDGEQRTPLSLAVADRRAAMVDLLLSPPPEGSKASETGLSQKTAPDPDFDERHGFPLHKAVELGDENTARVLLRHGFKADVVKNGTAAPIHMAARSRSPSMMSILLADGDVDLTTRNMNGETALYVAAEADNAAMCQAILEGAKMPIAAFVDIPDVNLDTPLYWASWSGYESVVELLLKNASVDKICSDGWTALHAASFKGMLGVATKLLDNGHAAPNTRTTYGSTALVLAAEQGKDGLVKLLLERKANPLLVNTSTGSTALHRAAQNGHLECVRHLVDGGAQLDFQKKNGLTALHSAAISDRIPVIEYLVGCGADLGVVSDGFGTALEIALSYHAEKTARFLLEHASRLSSEAVASALWQALKEEEMGEEYAVEPLLKALADPNVPAPPWSSISRDSFGSLLQAVAWKGRVDVAKKLLTKGAKVDTAGGRAGTALAAAASADHPEMAELLLENGADPTLTVGNRDGMPPPTPEAAPGAGPEAPPAPPERTAGAAGAQDPRGRSLLGLAVAQKSEKVVELLLKRLPRLPPKFIDAADDLGRTPLAAAVLAGNAPLVRRFLECGAEADAQDSAGRSPLSHAVAWPPTWLATSAVEAATRDAGGSSQAARRRNVRADMARALLDSEADPGLPDCRGRGPVYWAFRRWVPERRDEDDEADGALPALTSAFRDRHGSLAGQLALHAAAAAGNALLFDRLLAGASLEAAMFGDTHGMLVERDADGWTAAHTARCYGANELAEKLVRARAVAFLGGTAAVLATPVGTDAVEARAPPSSPVPPSAWHPVDHGPWVSVDGKTISSPGGPRSDGEEYYTLVRADHPMPGDDVFYFEITIHKGAYKGELAIGFCDEEPPVDKMLGWKVGSWGLHGDNGRTYTNGTNSSTGAGFTEPFDAPTVIGCGVNFERETAFYTRGGNLIGPAFRGIRGKLFPAVAFNAASKDLRLTAHFGPGKDGFKFTDWHNEETVTGVRLERDSVPRSRLEEPMGDWMQ